MAQPPLPIEEVRANLLISSPYWHAVAVGLAALLALDCASAADELQAVTAALREPGVVEVHGAMERRPGQSGDIPLVSLAGTECGLIHRLVTVNHTLLYGLARRREVWDAGRREVPLQLRLERPIALSSAGPGPSLTAPARLPVEGAVLSLPPGGLAPPLTAAAWYLGGVGGKAWERRLTDAAAASEPTASGVPSTLPGVSPPFDALAGPTSSALLAPSSAGMLASSATAWASPLSMPSGLLLSLWMWPARALMWGYRAGVLALGRVADSRSLVGSVPPARPAPPLTSDGGPPTLGAAPLSHGDIASLGPLGWNTRRLHALSPASRSLPASEELLTPSGAVPGWGSFAAAYMLDTAAAAEALGPGGEGVSRAAILAAAEGVSAHAAPGAGAGATAATTLKPRFLSAGWWDALGDTLLGVLDGVWNVRTVTHDWALPLGTAVTLVGRLTYRDGAGWGLAPAPSLGSILAWRGAATLASKLQGLRRQSLHLSVGAGLAATVCAVLAWDGYAARSRTLPSLGKWMRARRQARLRAALLNGRPGGAGGHPEAGAGGVDAVQVIVAAVVAAGAGGGRAARNGNGNGGGGGGGNNNNIDGAGTAAPPVAVPEIFNTTPRVNDALYQLIRLQVRPGVARVITRLGAIEAGYLTDPMDSPAGGGDGVGGGGGSDGEGCALCMVRRACVAGVPCGHVVLCLTCARRLLARWRRRGAGLPEVPDVDEAAAGRVEVPLHEGEGGADARGEDEGEEGRRLPPLVVPPEAHEAEVWDGQQRLPQRLADPVCMLCNERPVALMRVFGTAGGGGGGGGGGDGDGDGDGGGGGDA